MRVVILGLLPVVGCSPRVREAPEVPGPVIERVVPDRGPAGSDYPIRVTIEGRRFADSGNTVTFAAVATPDLPGTHDCTRIEMFLPKEGSTAGEVSPPPLLPGDYELTVTTPRGTSPPVRFTLTDPGRPL